MIVSPEYIKLFYEKLEISEEAQSVFDEINAVLGGDEAIEKQFTELMDLYMADPEKNNGACLDAVKKLGNSLKMQEYSIHFVFLMDCSERLRKMYAERGVSEEIFWKTIEDLRWKLAECIEVEHVIGTFVAGWDAGFFRMNRFGLGRLQYELVQYNGEGYNKKGVSLKPGDTIVNIHIPSAGPLTDENLLDSFKRAYDFYGCAPGKLICCCGSWLLYPEHRNFLYESSGILKFMDCFDIVSWSEKSEFSNDWRVFGGETDNGIENLPERTRLQRAYKKRLMDGKPTGDGYGILVFDGERIL